MAAIEDEDILKSYFAFGSTPGDVLKDEKGIKTIRTLSENMAWLMKKLG